MPQELLYSLIDMTRKGMVDRIENKILELRASCASEKQFQHRCECLLLRENGWYEVYLFDNRPVFYTHLWFDGVTINWTIQDGEPPIEWNSDTLNARVDENSQRRNGKW